MNLNITIKDAGVNGIQLAGDLGPVRDQPTPAQVMAMFMAAHPEVVAQLSWNWYAAQRMAAVNLKGAQS